MQFSTHRPPIFKVILLGESGVGKTSLYQRFRARDIPLTQRTALTLDSYQYNRQFPVGPQSKPIQIELWDTANMERMHSLTDNYFRETTAAILVYDIADSQSLQRLSDWRNDFRYHSERTLMFLVGNKVDLPPDKYDEDQTTIEHARKVMATNFEDVLGAYEVSAKEDYKVEEMFHKIGQILWENYKDERESTGTRSLPEIPEGMGTIKLGKHDKGTRLRFSFKKEKCCY
ncbi:ras-related protein Rab-6B-like [Lytechinus variegatus]|uniref:ras-related protein Rab-6B-like n=1 Tax=Lytechinus variegatus TaxID=7654 RepID=UPI001BB10265|nr:ras-related protein Rab-6B-like [Lytechinus variegatus]